MKHLQHLYQTVGFLRDGEATVLYRIKNQYTFEVKLCPLQVSDFRDVVETSVLHFPRWHDLNLV